MRERGEYDATSVTDLVNERTGKAQVRYPVWLVAFLIVFGIAAFTTNAYFGYPDDPPFWGALFHSPWMVFIWLCLLYLLLALSILRHPDLRRSLLIMLLGSLCAMALVSGAWYTGLVDGTMAMSALTAPLFGFPYSLLVAIIASMVALAALGAMAFPLKVVAALAINLAGVIGLLAGSEFASAYTHAASQTLTGDPRLAFARLLVIFLAAAGSMLGGFLALALACALLLLRYHVFVDAWRFLMLAPVFAYFFLPVFALVNSALWLTGISFRTPFFQPTVSAWIGILAFVVTGRSGVESALRRMTGRG